MDDFEAVLKRLKESEEELQLSLGLCHVSNPDVLQVAQRITAINQRLARLIRLCDRKNLPVLHLSNLFISCVGSISTTSAPKRTESMEALLKVVNRHLLEGGTITRLSQVAELAGCHQRTLKRNFGTVSRLLRSAFDTLLKDLPTE